MPRRRRARFHVALLALLGAAGIGVGAFAPAVRIDLYGTLRYWDLVGPEKYGVLAATALALPGIYGRRHGLIVLATLGLWGASAYPWIKGWIAPERHGLLARVVRAVTRPLTEMAEQLLI